MKLATFTLAWGWSLLGLSQAIAAPPTDAASGVFHVRYPGALFAFRVDPWSDDVRQIRGVGRAAFGAENDEYDLFFEILGTYRPGAAHTAQGLFLFRNDDSIQQIPWKGMYDREKKSFIWAIVNQGQAQLLLPAVPPTDEDRAAIALLRQQRNAATAPASSNATPATTENGTAGPPAAPTLPEAQSPATTSPPPAANPPAPSTPPTPPGTAATASPAGATPADSSAVESPPSESPSDSACGEQPTTTALSQRTPYLKEVLDEKGELDFSRVIVRAIDVTPAPKMSTVPKPQTAAPPESSPQPVKLGKEYKENLAILISLTELEKESEHDSETSSTSRKILKQILINSIEGRPAYDEPLRRRNEYPSEPPRVLRRLVKPNSPTASGSELVEPLPPGLFPRTSKTIPGVKTVPSVVGLSFDGAVNALWGAGLNPTTIECLGQSTDPEKADRVTSQSPAAGSPYPPDGNMTLQWYSKPTDAVVLYPPKEVTPADPAPSAPAGPVGFQPGDGAKVDGRFAGAEIYAGGKGIAFASGGNGGMNWSILKLDEPTFQAAVGGLKTAVQNLTNSAKTVGDYVVTVTQKGEGVIEFSATSPGANHTYCYQYREYRGFFINYAESVPTAGAALGPKAAAAIEKSQQLIDLRFPK